MHPCHHVCGHSSKALSALCAAYRRAQVVRHVPVEGVDTGKVLVTAYEAETSKSEDAMTASTAALNAFVTSAIAVLDKTMPEKGRMKDSPIHSAVASLRRSMTP